MLLGVAASTFPKSSWLAPSLAGFGSLQALILVLGGFHVASLKYHPYDEEAKYSMIGSTILITIYWGLSVQDPMVSFCAPHYLNRATTISKSPTKYGHAFQFQILHVVVKLIFWVASVMVYGVVKVVCKVWQYGKRAWTKVRTKVLSLKSTLMACIHTVNDYQHLPQTVSSPGASLKVIRSAAVHLF